MERRPILFVLNLILPTCALYLLDMAVLFGPSALEEKISFQIAIILGSSMLAVILNDILPTSSNKPPVIGNHLCCINPNFYTDTNPKEVLEVLLDMSKTNEIMKSKALSARWGQSRDLNADRITSKKVMPIIKSFLSFNVVLQWSSS